MTLATLHAALCGAVLSLQGLLAKDIAQCRFADVVFVFAILNTR